MSNELNLFDYTFIDHQSTKTLFLLPGTGGDKTDLLFFDQLLKQQFNIVSLQGNVSEHGLLRFFRRLEMGVFDQESIHTETTKLKQFVEYWFKDKHLSQEQVTFLGYSNGANMSLAMLLLFPNLFSTAVLLHPMMPFPLNPQLKLSRHRAFVSVGVQDRMIPAEEGRAVARSLKELGVEVHLHEYPGGHEVSEAELTDITTFLTKN